LEIPRYIRLIQEKKMTLEGIITHEFRLEEINKALDVIREGKAARVVINMKA
jgi:S-(hydroxymethyl)glutathione dehydrogenase/alcohol dehydrogenase